jgi:hypothetical protein
MKRDMLLQAGSVALESVVAAVEQTPAANSYGQYSGFTVDYHGYEHYESILAIAESRLFNNAEIGLLISRKTSSFQKRGFECKERVSRD